MTSTTDIFDVIIVGAGPTGLACGIEAGRAGLSHLIVEKGAIADAIRRFPVNMSFFSTPELLTLGSIPFPTTNVRPTRCETLQYYRAVAEYFRLHLRLHTCVEAIQQKKERDTEEVFFHVAVRRGGRETVESITARRVVIATGYFDFTNRLDVEGEDLPHVSHYYDEPYKYAQSDVVVVGGRNSAVETALELWRHGARVTMVHRKPELGKSVKYWVRPDIENRLKNGDITAYFNAIVQAIRPGELDIINTETGIHSTLVADFVFPLIGYRPDEHLLRGAGVYVNATTLVPDYNPTTFETNVQGLYIAGSVACGCETWNIFIENGRTHAKPIMEHIAAQKL
jgi:thioredoxin reductase (NADPH)